MKTITQTAEIKRETEKAILVSSIHLDTYASVNHYTNVWLPKSKISIQNKYEFSDNMFCADISLPVWLLKDLPFEYTSKGDNSAWVQVFRDHCE